MLNLAHLMPGAVAESSDRAGGEWLPDVVHVQGEPLAAVWPAGYREVSERSADARMLLRMEVVCYLPIPPGSAATALWIALRALPARMRARCFCVPEIVGWPPFPHSPGALCAILRRAEAAGYPAARLARILAEETVPPLDVPSTIRVRKP